MMFSERDNIYKMNGSVYTSREELPDEASMEEEDFESKLDFTK